VVAGVLICRSALGELHFWEEGAADRTQRGVAPNRPASGM